jgi:hypothetical protein
VNHIHALQAQVAQNERDNRAQDARFDEFRVHLCGDKFCGFDSDGDRKDWIAVSDVNRWIEYIRNGGK